MVNINSKKEAALKLREIIFRAGYGGHRGPGNKYPFERLSAELKKYGSGDITLNHFQRAIYGYTRPNFANALFEAFNECIPASEENALCDFWYCNVSNWSFGRRLESIVNNPATKEIWEIGPSTIVAGRDKSIAKIVNIALGRGIDYWFFNNEHNELNTFRNNIINGRIECDNSENLHLILSPPWVQLVPLLLVNPQAYNPRSFSIGPCGNRCWPSELKRIDDDDYRVEYLKRTLSEVKHEIKKGETYEMPGYGKFGRFNTLPKNP